MREEYTARDPKTKYYTRDIMGSDFVWGACHKIVLYNPLCHAALLHFNMSSNLYQELGVSTDAAQDQSQFLFLFASIKRSSPCSPQGLQETGASDPP